MPTIDDIVKSQDQLPPTGVPGAPLSLDIGPAVALNSAPPIPIETPVLESPGAPAGGGALSGGGAGAAGSALSPGNLTLDPRLFQ